MSYDMSIDDFCRLSVVDLLLVHGVFEDGVVFALFLAVLEGCEMDSCDTI